MLRSWRLLEHELLARHHNGQPIGRGTPGWNDLQPNTRPGLATNHRGHVADVLTLEFRKSSVPLSNCGNLITTLKYTARTGGAARHQFTNQWIPIGPFRKDHTDPHRRVLANRRGCRIALLWSRQVVCPLKGCLRVRMGPPSGNRLQQLLPRFRLGNLW